MKKRNKPFRSVALAVLLSIGAGVIWGCLFGGVITIILMFTLSSFPSNRQEVLFTHDGTPVIRTVNPQEGVVFFHDLDGKPMNLTQGGTDGIYLEAPVRPDGRFRHFTWEQRVMNIYWGPYRTENWFLICDEKCLYGYLVGYSLKTEEKIGYIGRDGFQKEKPLKEEQFAFDLPHGNLYRNVFWGNDGRREGYGFYLLTDKGVVGINIPERSAKIVL